MSEIISIAKEIKDYKGQEISVEDVPGELRIKGIKMVGKNKTIQSFTGPTDSGECYGIDLIQAWKIDEEDGSHTYNLSFQVSIDRQQGDGYKAFGEPVIVTVSDK